MIELWLKLDDGRVIGRFAVAAWESFGVDCNLPISASFLVWQPHAEGPEAGGVLSTWFVANIFNPAPSESKEECRRKMIWCWQCRMPGRISCIRTLWAFWMQ